MKNSAGLCAGLCLLFSAAAVLQAQNSSGVIPPPPVLLIQREWLKPGKTGAMHEKSESQFVSAFAAAKWPTHYLAAESLSGRPRVLFMLGYPSFEAFEKDNHAMEKNPTLSAALDRASASDGELLSEFEQEIFVYDPDLSLRAGDVVHARYFEIAKRVVKQGHRDEFEALVKLYKDGFEKAAPAENWALYESYYGENNGGMFLFISQMKSLAEDDQGMGDDKKFADTVGPAMMKKIREMTADCIESEQVNLFEFNPKMSYPGDDWIKADPFWKPKPAAAKKPTATP